MLCGVLMTAGCGGRKSEQYRREGDTLFHLGKFADAAGAYRRAEEVDPTNALAKVGQGRCCLVEQRYDEALAQFRDALAIDPTIRAAYLESIRVLVKRGDAEGALAMAQRYEGVEPEQGGIMYAYVLRETGRPLDALEHLGALRERSPESANVRVELAAAYLAAAQPEKAETELKALLDGSGPESVAARLLLIDAYQAQGKASEILAQYERLVRERPEDIVMKVALTQSLLKVGRAEDAERIARAVYDEQPDSGWANYVLGSCLLVSQRAEVALPYLEKAAADLPDNAQVAQKLAAARTGGKVAEPGVADPPRPVTLPTVSQVSAERAAANWRVLWQQAALGPLLERRAEFLAQGDTNVAETLALAAFFTRNDELTQELRAALPDDSPLHGYFDAVATGQSKAFFDHMKGWTETEEERSVLRANAFAIGLTLMGARAHAVHALSESFTASPKYGITLYNLAQVFRAAGMPLVAASNLRRLVPMAVNNLENHRLLQRLLREGQALDEAQKVAETTYSLFPDRPETCLDLAQAYLGQGLFDLAEKVLRRGVQAQPEDVRVQLALGRTLLHAGKPEEALALLVEVPAREEIAKPLTVARAFGQAALKAWPQVRELTGSLDAEAMAPAVRLLHAAALIHAGQAPAALRVLRAGAGDAWPLGPYEKIVPAALGESIEGLGDAETALMNRVAETPALLGQYTYGLACLKAPFYKLALEGLRELNDELGGEATLAALMLHCMAQVVPAETRAEQARDLAAKYPTATRVWLGLADVMRSLDDVDGEREALARAVEAAPNDPEAWRKSGRFFDRQDEFGRAADAYDHLVALIPDDMAGNNNLAYCLLMADGDLDKALRHAEAALAQDPSNPLILHTLGVVQFRRNDLEGADKNLRLAMTLRPGDPTVLLDYGQLLIAQGKRDEGLRHVELALRYTDQMGLDFPRRAEAEGIAATMR